MEKADIVRMSSKGQVVIPQNLRQKLGLGARSQLLIYRYADTLIMKKLDVKDVEKRLGALYRRIDARTAKYGELNDVDVPRAIESYSGQKVHPSASQSDVVFTVNLIVLSSKAGRKSPNRWLMVV